MAPLYQAINAEFAYKTEDSTTVYRGVVDPEWRVVTVPHGGYALGLIVEAAVKYQASTPHPDPIHVTAHFIQSAILGPFEVHIRNIKTGKGFKNLSATLVQNGREEILTHMIFGVLEPPEEHKRTRKSLTVEPPSPYAVRTPMSVHPSECNIAPEDGRWDFRSRKIVAQEPHAWDKLKEPHQGLEWVEYLTLSDKNERLRPSMVPFLADSCADFTVTLPDVDIRKVWLPTMVMTVEYKFPLPKPSDKTKAQRTVAIYTSGKFVNDPSCRHEVYGEIWTAPADIGDGEKPSSDDWQEHQRCLAVTTQMALTVPASVNLNKGRSLKTKL